MSAPDQNKHDWTEWRSRLEVGRVLRIDVDRDGLKICSYARLVQFGLNQLDPMILVSVLPDDKNWAWVKREECFPRYVDLDRFNRVRPLPSKSFSDSNLPAYEGQFPLAKQRFWKTVVTVTVLTSSIEAPVFDDLSAVAYEIDEGDASGQMACSPVEVSKEEMRELLKEQGSDPDFLIDEED